MVAYHEQGAPIVLPTLVQVALLRIAQSALGNVIAHSGAQRADVTLTFMDATVALDVVDDGRGFDPAEVARRTTPSGSGTGLGLPLMQARVEELGGRLSVESGPGRGTAVAVEIGVPVEVDAPVVDVPVAVDVPGSSP